MDAEGIKARIAAVSTTVAVVSLVGMIGMWARGAPAEVPLKIEPAAAPKSTGRASEPAGDARLVVQIAGEVRHPGVYRLESDARVGDGIRAAGGVTSGAASENLNLAAHLTDGEKFVVPLRGAIAPATGEFAPVGEIPLASERPRTEGRSGTRRSSRTSVASGGARRSAATLPQLKPDAWGYTEMKPYSEAMQASEADEPVPDSVSTGRALSERTNLVPPTRGSSPMNRGAATLTGRISLNRATLADLDRLPGVGPSTAQKILTERRRRGGFRRIDDLLDVKGLGPAKVAKIRPFVTL